MQSVTVWAVPALATALSAIAAARAAGVLRAATKATRALELRQSRTIDSVRRLLAASRRSSTDVLAALDHELRAAQDRCDGVLVFAPDGEELQCVYAGGVRVAHFQRLRLRGDDMRLIAAKAAALRCRARYPSDGAALLPTDRYAIAVPMIDDARLCGVAYVCSVCELPAGTDDAVVATIACASAPYAIALEREADRAGATFDGLTGLLSAGAFRRMLKEHVERCTAAMDSRVMGLWFVDTDSFKTVNDAFGHRAGDAVLQALAQLLVAHLVPELDVAGRNGGDEFCALLRDSGKGRAIARAQAFCEAVAAHDFGLPVPVTASIGVAAYPRDAATPSELLETADAAMYHSKRSGRNRVSFVSQPGGFACAHAEAALPSSRRSQQWRSQRGEFFVERS